MSQEKGLLRFFGQMDIFSFIHMSITEGLSQIAADGIDNAQLPPETILHLPGDFPLLFSLQYKNHHNLLFIILFGRAHLFVSSRVFYSAKRSAAVLEKSIFFTSPISPVKDDGQTAYRRSSLPIVSFA